MAERSSGRMPKTTSAVRGEDWDGEDLSGRTFDAVAFLQVDLTDAVGTGVRFDGCTFTDCRLSGMQLKDSSLTNCAVWNSNLFDTQLTDCKLIGSAFEECRYDLLRVTGGDWSFVSLRGADLRETTFERVRMREADLTGARLDKAVLRRCDLSGAALSRASLLGTELRGSELPELDPAEVPMRGAIVDPHQAMMIAVALGLDVRPEDDDAHAGRAGSAGG